jgi:hypothetical protein
MLESKVIASVSKKVNSRFPDVSSSHPTIRAQNPPQSKSTAPGSSSTYLLTYRGSALLPGGKSIPRLVRVVVNVQGKILKITTSR